MSDTDQKGDAPKYKLTEKAFIDDVLYEEGATITYAGVPGHHMEPANAAAKAMRAKHPNKYIDPILAMTNVSAPAGSDLT
jgi:hypothetical protein